jgi:hypothetical protein
MSRRFFILFIALSFVALFPGEAYSATPPQTAQVTLPAFAITLNDRLIDNSARRYPLILYKNITYVPMTWFDCRYLGLETHYNEGAGGGELIINLTGAAGGYYEDLAPDLNRGRAYTAQIAGFAVTVNGKAVQNSQELTPC